MALDVESLQNAVVVDNDGKEVGDVLEVHRDAFSGRPAWVTVKGGLLHGKSLVPVGDNEPVDGRLHVPYDGATIRKAPYVDLSTDELLDEEMAREEGEEKSLRAARTNVEQRGDIWQLYEYYGLPFGRPDTTGSASPEADYGFGSAGTSPAAEGARRTEAEIAEAYPADELAGEPAGAPASEPASTGAHLAGGPPTTQV